MGGLGASPVALPRHRLLPRSTLWEPWPNAWALPACQPARCALPAVTRSYLAASLAPSPCLTPQRTAAPHLACCPGSPLVLRGTTVHALPAEGHAVGPPSVPAPPVCVQVVLPEGASDPVATTDLPLAAGPTLETKYTYLDVMGRPVVVLRARNLVSDMAAVVKASPGSARARARMGEEGRAQPRGRCLPARCARRRARRRALRVQHALFQRPTLRAPALALQVEYSYSTLGLLQKPLLLVGAFGLLFVAAIVLNRGGASLAAAPGAQAVVKAHAS